MATVAIDERDVWGSHQVRWGSFTFDSSYPTGGEAVTAADFQLSELKEIVVHSASAATFRPAWDATNSKILLFIEDGTSGIEAQAANASDQSAVVVRYRAIGK